MHLQVGDHFPEESAAGLFGRLDVDVLLLDA